MTDAFISYAREDTDFVRRLHEGLDERGHSAWVDWEGIPPSPEWMREIHAAERTCFVTAGDANGERRW